MNYEQKYLKYKSKYLQLKSIIEDRIETQLTTESKSINEQPNQTSPIYITQIGGGTHREHFLKKHNLEDKGYSLSQLSKISGVSLATIQKVYDRGSGAYKTNRTSVRMKGSFKKNVNAPYKMKLSKEQWAMARVYSFLDGNPKHDTDLR
jgi:DNA-binding transcriptional regulator YhcF (GntR family)